MSENKARIVIEADTDVIYEILRAIAQRSRTLYTGCGVCDPMSADLDCAIDTVTEQLRQQSFSQ